MTPVFIPNSDPDRVRVATYARQSHANEDDSQASPLAQRQSGEAYTASQPNWEHVAHYEDIGISGYDPDAYRPEYEEMMQDVRDGKLDVIVVPALSRLTRKGVMDALQIREELEKHGVGLVSIAEPFVNTAQDNPFAVAFFALIAALAHQESKNKSEFITRAMAKHHERGGHVSGSLPWWADVEQVHVDGVTIRRLKPQPEMVPLAKRIIKMGTEGMSYNSISDTLQDEGVPSPARMNSRLRAQLEQARNRRATGPEDDAPAEWSANIVARFLLDPRIAGFAAEPTTRKTLARTILRDDSGDPIAPHVGIIAPAEWYELQEVLKGRKRHRKKPRSGKESFLGSWGILRCGICGSGMNVSWTDRTYVCNLRRTVGSIPRHVLRVPMAETDDVVSRRMWTRIGALDPATNDDDAALLHEATTRFAHNNTNAALDADRKAVQAQLEHVQGTLAQLYEDRADGLYAGKTGRAAFSKQVHKLTAHEESCTERLAELNEAARVATVLPLEEWAGGGDDPMSPGSPWSVWTLDERREFTAIWVDAIHIAPMGPRSTWGPRGDRWGRTNRRVSITWATAREDEDESAEQVAAE